MAPWCSGQHTVLSRLKQGFDSPWSRHLIETKRGGNLKLELLDVVILLIGLLIMSVSAVMDIPQKYGVNLLAAWISGFISHFLFVAWLRKWRESKTGTGE